jgi:hypothetical protein
LSSPKNEVENKKVGRRKENDPQEVKASDNWPVKNENN